MSSYVDVVCHELWTGSAYKGVTGHGRRKISILPIQPEEAHLVSTAGAYFMLGASYVCVSSVKAEWNVAREVNRIWVETMHRQQKAWFDGPGQRTESWPVVLFSLMTTRMLLCYAMRYR